MTKKYKQLTYEQRCQISALKKRGNSQRAIAKLTGVSQSTISRELSRNTGERGYRHKKAQRKTVQRRAEAVKPTKMIPSMIELIESELRLDWSPEQISGWLLESNVELVSYETIYLHVWADKKAGGDLYTHLRHQGKKYNKRRHGKSSWGQIKNRVSIDDRPEVVDDRSRVGDWETDRIIGKGHSGALVTIVERFSKLTVSAQVNSKNAADVEKATIALLSPSKRLYTRSRRIMGRRLRSMNKSVRRYPLMSILRTLTALGSGG